MFFLRVEELDFLTFGFNYSPHRYSFNLMSHMSVHLYMKYNLM